MIVAQNPKVSLENDVEEDEALEDEVHVEVEALEDEDRVEDEAVR